MNTRLCEIPKYVQLCAYLLQIQKHTRRTKTNPRSRENGNKVKKKRKKSKSINLILEELECLRSVRNDLSLEGNLSSVYQNLQRITLIDYPHVVLSLRKSVPTPSERTASFIRAFVSKLLPSAVNHLHMSKGLAKLYD